MDTQDLVAPLAMCRYAKVEGMHNRYRIRHAGGTYYRDQLRMNNVRLEHYGKVGENGKPSFVLAGKGKLYINGHLVEGVLEFEPHLVDTNEVSHVVIKLAVSEFTYGPERKYAEYSMDDGTKVRLPIA